MWHVLLAPCAVIVFGNIALIGYWFMTEQPTTDYLVRHFKPPNQAVAAKGPPLMCC